MGRLLKFWQLSRREKLFFFEASALLLISNLSVKQIAFRHIDSFLRARWSDQNQPTFGSDDDVKLVNLSLSRIANLLPWKGSCLSRSIAAFIMLRRRGIPAAIIAGVKFSEDRSLHAHAWVHIGHGEPDGNAENPAFTPVVKIG
jgi:Transglutaminase-like superfamily